MGNLISKFKSYVHTKVDNTKSAIRTRVTNTRNAIYSKVDNTKQAIVNRVVNTKNAVCQKVVDTKVGIQNKIFAASDAVFSTVNGIKDGVVDRVTNTVTGVKNIKTGVVNKCASVKNSVVTKCTNTKNAVVGGYIHTRDGIVNRYRDTKNGVVTRYTNTRNYIQEKYRQAREAKLTRYEKAKYSVLFLLFLFVFVVTVLTLWDMYHEDYNRASARLQAIRDYVFYLLENLWYCTQQAIVHILYATRVFLEYLWFTIQVIASYTWIATKIAADYTWQGTKLTASYILEGIKISWAYFIHGCKLTLYYLGQGIRTSWEYFVYGSKVTGEYTWYGTKVAAHYTLEGSKLAADYSYRGAKYSLINGSIALKNGSIKFVQWLFYFLTNFRAASKEAAIYLYETSIWGAAGLMSGSYHGSILLWDGTQYMAVKSYQGSIAFGEWSVATAVLTWEYLLAGVNNFTHCTQVGVTGIYDGIVYTAVTVHQWSVLTVETVTHCSVTSANFLWTWGKYIVATTSHGLYIALNKYGLVWAYIAANKVSQWSCGLASILLKFVLDLGTYVANFVVVGGSHIYSLFYIVYSFIRQIFTGTTGFIKVTTGAMVYCVTTVFSGIIWVLEETIFAYMFMLHKYNMYREILFVGFIMVMCLYCTGLLRDRKRSLLERNGRASSSESEEEDDETTTEDTDGSHKPRLVPRLKDLELPPYPETQGPETLNLEEEEQDDEPIVIAARTIKPMLEDFLPPTDDEDEFDLEHDVPDFMQLSCSEPEPEPPEEDDEGRVHDLSFGSQNTDGSCQEVPDIDDGVSDGENLDNEDDHLASRVNKVPEESHGSSNFQQNVTTSNLSMGQTLDGIDSTDPNLEELDLALDLELDQGHDADDEDEEEATEALVQRLDSIKRRKDTTGENQQT